MRRPVQCRCYLMCYLTEQESRKPCKIKDSGEEPWA